MQKKHLYLAVILNSRKYVYIPTKNSERRVLKSSVSYLSVFRNGIPITKHHWSQNRRGLRFQWCFQMSKSCKKDIKVFFGR